MKASINCVSLLWGCALTMAYAQPAFTSLHVFGDSASSTTDSPGGIYYHGNRWGNGRMWVEVLADWRGMSFDITNNNQSFWEHYSPILVDSLNFYTNPPADVGTALFAVWVNNADMYWNITTYLPYDDSNLAAWTNANNQWVTNHFRVVTNLYSKGVRNLLMPNAVDLTKTPNFPGLDSNERAWIRQRTVEFNGGLNNMLSNAMAALPGLTVYSPDVFTLFDKVLNSPTNYGLYMPPSGLGAIEDLFPVIPSLKTNPGPEYVYWDYIHPTAKFQSLIAEEARTLIWPTRITGISSMNGTNRLSTMNVPIGRAVDGDGQVDGSTNFMEWTSLQPFARTNTSPMIPVPVSGPAEFYRLKIPSDWVWP